MVSWTKIGIMQSESVNNNYWKSWLTGKENPMVNIVKAEEIADLKILTIDQTKSQPERLTQFFKDVKNPYMVRVGDTLVRIEFIGGRNFSDALTVAFSV